jgi:hypothetical protein
MVSSLSGPVGIPWLTSTIYRKSVDFFDLLMMVVQENICGVESDLTLAHVERDIRIQSGALARLCKEYTFYQTEASKLDQKVRDLKV